jgi:hypothetical protein
MQAAAKGNGRNGNGAWADGELRRDSEKILFLKVRGGSAVPVCCMATRRGCTAGLGLVLCT